MDQLERETTPADSDAMASFERRATYPLKFGWTDETGDTLTATESLSYNDRLILHANHDGLKHPHGPGAYLSREGAERFRDFLTEWLGDAKPVTALPDAEADGYGWGVNGDAPLTDWERVADWERELLGEGPSRIGVDAHAATYGERQDDYGHPRENLTRTATIWTALLQPLLAEGAYIDAPDVARCMLGSKLSRDVSSPKRDNRVDMAGFAIVLDRLETGK